MDPCGVPWLSLIEQQHPSMINNLRSRVWVVFSAVGVQNAALSPNQLWGWQEAVPPPCKLTLWTLIVSIEFYSSFARLWCHILVKPWRRSARHWEWCLGISTWHWMLWWVQGLDMYDFNFCFRAAQQERVCGGSLILCRLLTPSWRTSSLPRKQPSLLLPSSQEQKLSSSYSKLTPWQTAWLLWEEWTIKRVMSMSSIL